MDVVKPIFMVGTGRCGSTIIFEALSVHERLGWLSNYNKLLPWLDLVSVMPRIYNLPFFRNQARGEKKQYGQGRGLINKILPTPFECYPKWEKLVGEKFSYSFLRSELAAEDEKRRVRRFFTKLLSLQGKERMAAKLTGPTRMVYLDSIFPDSKFVHIIRDARAVAYSLLNVSWWTDEHGRKSPMWRDGLPENWEQEWERYDRRPVALAAMQYRAVMEVCAEECKQIGEGRYLEVRYEEFVDDPHGVMDRILNFYELPPSPRVTAFLDNHQYHNQNNKYISLMSEEEMHIFDQIIGADVHPI